MRELAGQLVETVQELYGAGLITPTGGNVSLRLPSGGSSEFLITPSGMHKGSLRPEDIIPIDGAGRARTPRPSIETPMHLRIYQLRPTCDAVIHTHAPAATLLGLAALPIQPVTLDAVRFLDTPLVPFRIPGSQELVDAVAAALMGATSASPAILLQNHGLVTFGPSLREAANYALALEEVCRLLLEAQALGHPLKLISEAAVAYLREHLLA